MVVTLPSARRLKAVDYIHHQRKILSNILLFVCGFFIALAPTQIAFAANDLLCPDGMSDSDCAAIYGDWVEWDVNGSVCVGSGGSVVITGDNPKDGYNFFIEKGLTPEQSAGFIGNFLWESGMNPGTDQDGGPAKGIAQWEKPGRWEQLEEYAAEDGRGERDLGLQLDFAWMELTGVAPAESQDPSLEKVKETSTPAEAAEAVMVYYERPSELHLEERIRNANQVFNQYGGGSVGLGSPGCSGGSVNCDNPTGEGQLSQVRQDVVCLARAELALWETGKMNPGTDFYKYSEGRYEQWCADFMSWIYNEAQYPIGEPPAWDNWNVPIVSGIREIGEAGIKFDFNPVGGNYTPVPGDIVVQQGGPSHVMMVVAVDAIEQTMEVIGGNQGGGGSPGANEVTSYSRGFSGSNIQGYVSPK